MFTKAFLICTTLMFCAAESTAQEMVVRDRTGSDIVFFEPHFLLSDTDTHTVVIPYRIRYDFFVFTRKTDAADELFTAAADIVIEILDSTGMSIARSIDNIELSSISNTTSELRKRYFQGIMRFHLPRGGYTILLKADDRESHRSIPNNKKTFTIPARPAFLRSSFIPVLTADRTPGVYKTFNIGGDVVFSNDFGILFLSTGTEPVKVAVVVKPVTGDDDEEAAAAIDTIVTCQPILSSSIEFYYDQTDIRLKTTSSERTNIFVIPVHGSLLRQGRYVLSLVIDDVIQQPIPFAARWLEMPVSLSDLDIATLPLQYLLVHDDYSALRRGSRESRIQKFEEFWKKKDPTPTTAYNEMMAEFYRRVDHAVVAFRTLREPNGSLTDRGKIYILFGKPTSTDRILTPGSAPKEIWKYENVKKTFIFEDPDKQGNYKLAESQ